MCATSGSDSASTFWHTCLPHKVETPVIFGIRHGLHLVRLAYLLMEAVSIFGGYNRYRIRVPAPCFVVDRVVLQQLVWKSNSTHVQIVIQDWSIILHHPFDHLPREARMDGGVNRSPPCPSISQRPRGSPLSILLTPFNLLNFKWGHRLVHLDRIFCCPGTHHRPQTLFLAKQGTFVGWN